MKVIILKKKIPTDLEILELIYEESYKRFVSFDKDNPDRSAKVFVPFDLEGIAEKLNVDGDIIFGRLYYHLNKKYGYRKKNNTTVSVYATVGGDGHSINMPLTASIIASLREEKNKFWIATTIAVVSLIISIISFFT